MPTSTILICDDEAVIRELVRDTLAPLGVRIVEAGSVRDAGAALAARRVDLLVLDLALPDGSGLDLLRGLPAAGRPPTIVLSAWSRDEEQDAAALGVVAHVAKPFSPRALREVVRSHLP